MNNSNNWKHTIATIVVIVVMLLEGMLWITYKLNSIEKDIMAIKHVMFIRKMNPTKLRPITDTYMDTYNERE